MSPYRQQGRRVWQLRVVGSTGRARVCSTGTSDRAIAERVERVVTQWRDERRWDVLDAIVTGGRTLSDAYDAHRAKRLDAWVADAVSQDLDPLLAEWVRLGTLASVDEKQAATRRKYGRMVRRLVLPGTRFPASQFTAPALGTFLETLTDVRRAAGEDGTRAPASNATKNRYRSALRQFAKWLVRRQVLADNPLREVDSHREPHGRTIYYTVADAQRLVRAMPDGDARVLAALMCGTGVEWGAVKAARARDVDLTLRLLACFPAGRGLAGKTPWRARQVECTEDWCWPIIAAHVAQLQASAPNARLIAMPYAKLRAAHIRTAKALGLPASRLHDWRHTYAVTALQRGDHPQQIKSQLGHAPNSTLLFSRYGVWHYDPVAAATARAQARATTNNANAAASSDVTGPQVTTTQGDR